MSISNMMTPKDHQSQLLSYPAPITAIKNLKIKAGERHCKVYKMKMLFRTLDIRLN